MMISHRQILKKAKVWVIKIGSSILTHEKNAPNPAVFTRLASEITSLVRAGRKVILVSSGAIACGMYKLGFKRKPHLISQKQAIAAAGQIDLMKYYEKAFAKQKLGIAQILLTRSDLADRERYLNARHAIHELLQLKLIPVINENDTVVVDEIKVGDNDNLAALVSNMVEAEALVILTDEEGFYTTDPKRDPKAQKIPLIDNIDEHCHTLAQDTLRPGSTGGMITKLQAAEKAAHFGIPTVLASGSRKGVLLELAEGNEVGTLILPREISMRLNRRKHWIAYTLKPAGQIWVDAGAKEALLNKGKSLLSSGIKKVTGTFEIGEAVDLLVESEEPFARGLAGYSSAEIEKIKGAKSSEIEARLGYKYLDEVIHRDDLVILGG